MDLDFTGKVALITGAGNGIGRATTLAFARSGAKVVVVDRDTAGGEATAGIVRQQGGLAHFVAADVTKSAEVRAYVKAALDTYGAIDCFFNNAGIEGKWAHTAEHDEDAFDQVIAVNVKGSFSGCATCCRSCCSRSEVRSSTLPRSQGLLRPQGCRLTSPRSMR